MLDKFLSYIKEENLFILDDKLLLAVSGGIDSMVMTDLIKRSGFEFGIAHINHHLRGEESNNEEQFIKDYCSQNSIKYHIHHLDSRVFDKGNMHSIARAERYKFLYSIKKKNDYTRILTAHHNDDSEETFFINLLRGAGINGLTGINSIKNEISRPMLCFSRKEIEQYAQLKNIIYNEDSSNALDKYFRNKIRHHLIPVFHDISANTEQSIQKTISNLKSEQALLNELIAIAFEKSRTYHPEYLSIDLAILDAYSQKVTLLFKIIEPYGFGFEVAHSVIMDGSQASKFYSTSHEALIDRGKLLIRKTQNKENIFQSIDLNSLPLIIKYYSKRYCFNLLSSDKVDFSKSNELYLDSTKLRGSLVVRNWKEGDRFAPIGMNGKSKKIKDYLIDKKVSQWQKDATLILESNEKIVAILGHTIADSVKIDGICNDTPVLKIIEADE